VSGVNVKPGGMSPGVAWVSRAAALAAWAMRRLVVRRDGWGGYRPDDEVGKEYTRRDGTVGKLGAQTTRKGTLTEAVLARHFAAAGRADIVGTHTTSPDSTSLWAGIDIDWHGAGSTAPEVNWGAALHWYGGLRYIGFWPLLTDSNGKGGFHLRLLLSGPVPTPRLYGFLGWLTRDFKELGFPKRPECFPKQPRVTAANPWGNWMRLPGRHHSRDFWSRVWTGETWVEGDAAVNYILTLEGDNPDLLLVPRIEAYQAKLPNLGEGQGRDDVGYNYAAFLVRDLALSDDEARPWLERWDAGNRPPKGEAEVTKWLANAHKYGQRAYGSGLDAAPPRNGQGQAPGTPPPAAEPAPPAEGATAYELILADLRARYRPAFRRGEAIYSAALGREVRKAEATTGAPYALVRQLTRAEDALRKKGERAALADAHKRYRTWAPSAWTDLLAELPDEHDAAEQVPAAADEFGRLVACALRKIVPMGREEKDPATGQTVTRVEQRSILDWCQLWAKRGERWQRIRAYWIWARRDRETGLLEVALRHGLFQQVGPRELAQMTEQALGETAEMYGVGRRIRAGGERAVELGCDYLAALLAEPGDQVDAVNCDNPSEVDAVNSPGDASPCDDTPQTQVDDPPTRAPAPARARDAHARHAGTETGGQAGGQAGSGGKEDFQQAGQQQQEGGSTGEFLDALADEARAGLPPCATRPGDGMPPDEEPF
jgi:hypothetical protein